VVEATLCSARENMSETGAVDHCGSAIIRDKFISHLVKIKRNFYSSEGFRGFTVPLGKFRDNTSTGPKLLPFKILSNQPVTNHRFIRRNTV
jgi:hypothetical protein